jgi:signal transduction histidine kinase
MIPFDLVRWLRPRMLLPVLSAVLLLSLLAPLSYYIEKRRELWLGAGASAARVASVLREEIQARPRLWRYNLVKLAERLAEEGMARDRDLILVIQDADGVAVPLSQALGLQAGAEVSRRRGLLWARADVVLPPSSRTGPATSVQARIWVAADTAPLLTGTLTLGLLCAALAVVLGAALYLLPMRAIAAAQRRITALTGRLALTLQEEDRRRIARDLHDGAGQALTAARLQLLCAARTSSPEALASAARHLDEAIDEVRRSTSALMPPALSALGLAGALRRHCADFAASTGLQVCCQIAEDLGPIPPAVETACYRIAQEALHNVARHARARRATVHLSRRRGRLVLQIHDDGEGAVPDPDPARPGLGLAGMEERARMVGGDLQVTSGREGVRVVATLPATLPAAAPLPS